MSSETATFRSPFPPPVNREMKTLDCDFFRREIPIVAAIFNKPAHISTFSKKFRDLYILQLPGVNHVADIKSQDENDNKIQKAVLLNYDITSIDQVETKLSSEALAALKEAGAELIPYTLVLDYTHWRADEILSAILPEDLLGEVPTGFTVIGHIAHLNLRDEYLPYKNIIGEIIYDKNPRIRTVINKLDSIDTKFRTFAMEVLAGEEDFEVEQSESGCKFQFDFRKVYWNSRLHSEHDRLVRQFAQGSAVCDVMAGVGPFAVPAGKKKVITFANDLNPESYTAMVNNIKINKVGSFVFPSNLDGLEFIQKSSSLLYDFAQKTPVISVPATSRPKRTKTADGTVAKPTTIDVTVPLTFDHYVMNLPDSAIEFLGAFRGLYADDKFKGLFTGDNKRELPLIHVHCFHKSEPASNPTDAEVYEALRQRVSKSMKFEIAVEELSFHYVRKVAPTKDMYCITYRVPAEVAFARD